MMSQTSSMSEATYTTSITTSSGATKSVLQHDVKRNVTYVIANGKQTAPASVNDSLHYEAAVTVDKVTAQVVKTVWSNAQDFKDVASPAVNASTADKIGRAHV